MKAHLLRSNSRRPAFFNISIQKKKFPTQGPEIGNTGGQSVILPVKLGNQSDKSKESSQSAKGYS